MKHSIIALLVAAISTLGIFAQDTKGPKILVFRNTGEINIFNSDSISKVELSCFDTDSIQHDEFVSQVFHYKNSSSVAVPIAEIDSVAFGYRNVIEPKKGVRRLTDEEAEAISSFDGETIIFDSRLSLTTGETVYYDCLTDILPIGLCVRINDVYIDSGLHKAQVTMLEPDEVFDRYLITGDFFLNDEKGKTRADDYDSTPFELDLPEINTDGTRIEGKIGVKIDSDSKSVLSDVVINPLKHYYHAKISLHLNPNVEFKAFTSNKYEVNLEVPYQQRPKLCIPPAASTSPFRLVLAFDPFLDISAEIGFDYEYSTDYHINTEWTRKDGINTFSKPVVSQEDIESHQKMEVHLSGELFVGPRLDTSIQLPFNVAGAGFEVKVGRKWEGELSLGLLQDMTEKFDVESYGKANLYSEWGLKMETYISHRNLKDITEIKKIKLPFEVEHYWSPDTIHLLPEFHTKAVICRATAPIVQTGKEPEAVSISSFTETELTYPLDISFEIADKDTDKTLAETEVTATLETEKEDYQTVYSEVIIPTELGKIDKDAIVGRPVINYKGYKVKADPVNAAGDMIMTPNICSLAGGSTYFVSGMTPVSQHTFGETTYIEGNLVGYGVKSDPRYKKRKFKMYEFIDLSDPASCNGMHGEPVSLYGVWIGKIADEDVSFTFTDNENGSYNGTPFIYTFNSPQRGGIAIQLSTGGSISFHIVDISDDSMTIIMKGSEKEIILYRR